MKPVLTVLLMVAFFFINAQNKWIEKSGDILQIAIPAAALGTSITDNSKDKPVVQFVKSYLLSLLVTHGLKRIINEKRPNGGAYSFPSGHTTSAFSGAAFLQKRYGWKIGAPAYLLASFVGFSRVYAHKHYTWDVAAGALIGIGSAYLFVKPQPKQKLSFYFDKVQQSYLVGFNYKF